MRKVEEIEAQELENPPGTGGRGTKAEDPQ